ncbi:hypothetical protein CRG98_039817 [Punica granatum]|uniref:Uncharacterized protein n=1 Tax=Punica granatum TaxID=22663 RepID=A0A2I0I727_PUNGR|nr:hypothetical protein CRG98_039817 [Punica granatum]
MSPIHVSTFCTGRFEMHYCLGGMVGSVTFVTNREPETFRESAVGVFSLFSMCLDVPGDHCVLHLSIMDPEVDPIMNSNPGFAKLPSVEAQVEIVGCARIPGVPGTGRNLLIKLFSVARQPRLSSPSVLVIPFPDELLFCLLSITLISDSQLRLLSVALMSDSPSSSLSRSSPSLASRLRLSLKPSFPVRFCLLSCLRLSLDSFADLVGLIEGVCP